MEKLLPQTYKVVEQNAEVGWGVGFGLQMTEIYKNGELLKTYKNPSIKIDLSKDIKGTNIGVGAEFKYNFLTE